MTIFTNKEINFKPYEELTMDNITNEIGLCTTKLYDSHIYENKPIEYCKRIAYRIILLKHWRANNKIDLSDVEEFEKDPEAWVYKNNDFRLKCALPKV